MSETPHRFNLADWLVTRHVREGRGASVAILADGAPTTYAELDARVSQAGHAFKTLGVAAEQRIVLVLHDSAHFYAAFLGAIKMGAIPVPVNTLLRQADYAYLLEDSRAPVVVVSEALLPEVLPIVHLAPRVRHVIVAGQARDGLASFDELMARESDVLEPADTHPDHSAFWLYSSGSTGAPKGVIHLQHDAISTIEGYAQGVLRMTAQDRTLSAAKLFFAYGLGNSLTFPLGLGAQAAVVSRRLGPDAMFDAIERIRPTVFFGVPTLFGAMLQVEGADTRYDLSSLRFCVSAGEPLPPEIFHRWHDRFGLEIVDGIGSTELLHIFISNRPGACRPGTAGIEVPGYDARIVDEHGHDAPAGEIGSLLVKGESAAAGYWSQHEKTKSTFQGHWVVTGDRFTRAADGFYTYCGRDDDMLKVGGIWVSPVEVEHAILAHDAVVECAVVGAPDADGLVKPKAFVVVRPGTSAGHELARSIQTFVRERIAPYKYPRWVEFVDALPKTATGKIQRFRLRAATATGMGSGVDAGARATPDRDK